MQLLNLPPELFRMILQQIASTMEGVPLNHVRLVCKLFNREITRAICDAKLYEPGRRPYLLLNVPQKTEYLFRKTIGDRTHSEYLPTTIRKIVEILSIADRASNENLREQKIRALCSAVVDYQPKNVHAYLKPDCEIVFKAQGRWGTFKSHVVAAAAYLGDDLFLEKLLEEGPIENDLNIYFGYPLACAARQGHYDTVKLLLERGVENAQAISMSPRDAAYAGHENIIRLLLMHKYQNSATGGNFDFADLDKKSGKDYDWAIIEAARGNHQELVRFLIEHGKRGELSLHNRILTAGAHRGHEEVVRMALDNGANPNCSEKKDGYYNPLQLATIRGQEKVVQMLLSRGGDQRIVVRKGLPFDIAVRRGYKGIVQMLLDDDVDVNIGVTGISNTGMRGCPPLITAAASGQADMVKFLFQRGLDLGTYWQVGQKALWCSISGGHESILRFLVAKGVNLDPSFDPYDGAVLNPVLEAKQRGQGHIVKTLIELGITRIGLVEVA